VTSDDARREKTIAESVVVTWRMTSAGRRAETGRSEFR